MEQQLRMEMLTNSTKAMISKETEGIRVAQSSTEDPKIVSSETPCLELDENNGFTTPHSIYSRPRSEVFMHDP